MHAPAGSGQPLTLVATDVEGSTELWEWNRAAMMDAQTIHDRLIRANLSKCFGYEVATEVRCRLCRPVCLILINLAAIKADSAVLAAPCIGLQGMA